MTQPDRPDVFLFSMGRTLSNLFCKLLSNQPGWSYGDYYFHDAYRYWKQLHNTTPPGDISPEQLKVYDDLLRQGWEKMQAEREGAKSEGKPMFIKNHIFQLAWPSVVWQIAPENNPGPAFCIAPDSPTPKTNPSFLPDEMLASFVPIFIIRHPALVVESWYRAETRVVPVDLSTPTWGTPTGFRFSRALHDWYLSRCLVKTSVNKGTGPFYPLVVEADDILEDSVVINRVCELCNMDPDMVPSEWETKPLPQDPWTRSFVQGLWTSTSIDKSKSGKGLTLADKHQQWNDEFGTEIADGLYKIAESHMEDYIYLKERKA